MWNMQIIYLTLPLCNFVVPKLQFWLEILLLRNEKSQCSLTYLTKYYLDMKMAVAVLQNHISESVTVLIISMRKYIFLNLKSRIIMWSFCSLWLPTQETSKQIHTRTCFFLTLPVVIQYVEQCMTDIR